MRPKPPVPWWRWAIWWVTLGLALVVFYVLLTPLWLGLRGLAWLAELREIVTSREGATAYRVTPDGEERLAARLLAA